MSNIAPVDRVGGVIPVSRRDRGHAPGTGDDRDGREQPAGRDPREDRREPPPGNDTSVVAPHSNIGQIVDTFAGSRSSMS